MNYELVDKVKSAKRTEQVAIKLYDKSKEVASRCLDKLVLKKEEKNQLKDELTRVIKAHDAQQKSLQEYKAMVEELRSMKQNLKRKLLLIFNQRQYNERDVSSIQAENA